MRGKPTTLAIGVISEGTLRPEDLIPAFLDALDTVRLSRKDRKTASAILKAETERSKAEELTPEQVEEQQEDLWELHGLLEQAAPEYCFFGASDGDGACFGVWPDWNRLDEDHRAGEIGRGDCLPSVGRFAFWLQINDHGNATLWRRAGRRWVKVWDVV